MNKLPILLITLISVFLVRAQVDKEKPIFKVSRANESIIIDGKMNETVWNKTEVSFFDYTYNATMPNDKQTSSLSISLKSKCGQSSKTTVPL